MCLVHMNYYWISVTYCSDEASEHMLLVCYVITAGYNEINSAGAMKTHVPFKTYKVLLDFVSTSNA